MKASDLCIEFLKELEGCETYPYPDVVGKMTIGVGHLIKPGEVFPVDGITDAEATKLLCEDLATFEACVDAMVEVPLNQNQFDALCSFAFNLGCGKLESSTLLRKLNTGDYKGAADEFLRWNKAGGKVFAGLMKRREKERSLFLSAATK